MKTTDSKDWMDTLHEQAKHITSQERFDTVTGSMFVINPIVIALQIVTIIHASNVESVSLGMWIAFVFLQVATTLVAIKIKNKALAISYFLSVL